MKKICEFCNGSSYFEKDGKIYECRCALLKRLAASMPIFIRDSRVKEEHANHILTNKYKGLYYIHCHWSDIKPIIKVTLIKNPNLHVKITSDREIRDVGVGATSKSAKSEDSDSIYNTLQELVEPPHLLIIRLNELGYKNKAAPGFLEEAISIRADRNMPVWVLSDKNKPFSFNSFAYSETVWDLISQTFRTVDIPKIADSTNLTSSISNINKPDNRNIQDISIDVKKPKTEDSIDVDDEDDGCLLGSDSQIVEEKEEISKKYSKPVYGQGNKKKK